MSDYLVGQLLGRFGRRVESQLGVGRRFVRVINPRKTLDFAGTGLLIQALGIARLANVDRSIDKDFNKVAGPQTGTNGVAVAPVRADKRGERDNARRREQLGHGADAADVLFAVLGGETQAAFSPWRTLSPSSTKLRNPIECSL
jgi:hypothetical protein